MQQITIKKIFIFILLAYCNSLSGQRSVNQNLKGFDKNGKIHFGFLLGINQLNFNLSVNNSIYTQDTIASLNIKSEPGLNIGMITDLHLGKNWDLRILPSLIFGARYFEYLISTDEGVFPQKRLSESVYIYTPIEIKYKAERYGNWRPYLTCGGFSSYDMQYQNFQNNVIDDRFVRLKRWDYGYNVGFGFEFFLEYFKFSSQFKWDKGCRNMIIKDKTEFTNVIDNISFDKLKATG